MGDSFFSQMTCDRCGGSLSLGRTMSMFSTDCICLRCAEQERRHGEYERARAAERAAVLSGDRNFPGIGVPPDLT